MYITLLIALLRFASITVLIAFSIGNAARVPVDGQFGGKPHAEISTPCSRVNAPLLSIPQYMKTTSLPEAKLCRTSSECMKKHSVILD